MINYYITSSEIIGQYIQMHFQERNSDVFDSELVQADFFP